MTEDRRDVEKSQYARCLAFVTEAHRAQRDKAGRPYIEHLLDVSGRAAQYGHEAKLAGLLHDVLEDTPTTLDDLRCLEVSDDVIGAVETVTRRPDESYEQFIDRVVDRGGLALNVKRANLQSNFGRLDAIQDEAARRRLYARYASALAKVREPSPDDKG